MDINTGKAAGDVFLFGIPLIALLVFGFFRLDQVFTAQKKTSGEASAPSPRHRERLMASDPDGRPWDD